MDFYPDKGRGGTHLPAGPADPFAATLRSAVAVVLAAAAIVLFARAAAAQNDDGGWVIEQFTADMTITPDGVLEVSEEITVDFGDLERHGIFRVLPVRYPVAADDPGLPEGVRAEDAERVLHVDGLEVTATAPADVDDSLEDANLVLRIGDPDETVSGQQTYRLRYRVDGALNATQAGAELRWNAIGDGWPVVIRNATTRIQAPAVTAVDCARGVAAATAACARVEAGQRGGVVGDGPLQPGEGLTVVVTIPDGAVAVAPPVIRERWRLGKALAGDGAALPLAGATTVAAAAGVTLLARRGRDERDDGAGAPAQALRLDPPDDLRPAQLRLLLDERVGQSDLAATLLDLAGRGLLVIERVGADEGDWRLHRRGDTDDANLLGYERHLLQALFDGADSVDLSELRGEFSDEYQAFCRLVEDDAVARGWFPRSPSSTRMRWLVIGLLATLAATALLVVALLFTTMAAVVIPLLVAAIALLAISAWMPHRTREGARLLREARMFRAFMRSERAGSAPAASGEPGAVFTRYLPYAVALGAVPQLVSRFGVLSVAPEEWAPVWYLHPATALWHTNPSQMVDDLSAFSDQVGGGLATAPASSTSTSTSVSSGSGFGGGGGGSW